MTLQPSTKNISHKTSEAFSTKSIVIGLRAVVIFVTLGFSLASQAARADQAGSDYVNLTGFVRQPRPNLQSVVVFDREGQHSALPPERVEALQTVAKQQAKVWADTILEGDYKAAGDTRLDRVEALYDSQSTNEAVAYRITYSEKAWYTADCDPRKDSSSCEQGRIKEASYVSPTTSSWVRDDSAYADFVSEQ